MTIIEGIGDEVIQFFVVVFIILVGFLAWWSTNIAEQPLVRAVLVLEMMTRHRSDTSSTSTTREESSLDTGQTSSGSNVEEETDNVVSEVSNPSKEASDLESDSVNESITCSPENVTEGSQAQTELQPNSNIDGNESTLRRRDTCSENEENSLTSPERSAIESTFTTDSNNVKNSPDDIRSSQAEEGENNTPGIIRIRLKYLNDTQKLVEGNLEEQLGEFKRRHFGLEIQTNKLVRLIFNGHVLQSDSETLQNYGLFDNCVVHCLVHNQQVSNSTASGNSVEGGQANGVDFRDMDNHLFGSLSFILVAAWYCRYTYAQLFTTTTTVALVCLTGVFFVSLLGVYLPDQGRERQ